MKQFEVVLDKEVYIKDWCIWDEKDTLVRKETTTAIVCAFNEDRLKTKLEKLYPGVDVISYREV